MLRLWDVEERVMVGDLLSDCLNDDVAVSELRRRVMFGKERGRVCVCGLFVSLYN